MAEKNSINITVHSHILLLNVCYLVVFPLLLLLTAASVGGAGTHAGQCWQAGSVLGDWRQATAWLHNLPRNMGGGREGGLPLPPPTTTPLNTHKPASSESDFETVVSCFCKFSFILLNNFVSMDSPLLGFHSFSLPLCLAGADCRYRLLTRLSVRQQTKCSRGGRQSGPAAARCTAVPRPPAAPLYCAM